MSKVEASRARRIRDKLRMKANAVRVYSRIDLHDQDPERVAESKSQYARLADHMTACSCQMCRNPRRSRLHSGQALLTMQERKHIEFDDWTIIDGPAW